VRYGKPPGNEEKDRAKEERSRQADHETRPEERDHAGDSGEHEPIRDDETPKEKAPEHRDLRQIGHQV
jgi:hypothetical protein